MQPLVEIAAEKTPMLPDLGGRQLTDSGELIDGGFWDAKEPRHLLHGQNLVVGCRYPIGMQDRGCWCDITHDHSVIGIVLTNLSAAPRQQQLLIGHGSHNPYRDDLPRFTLSRGGTHAAVQPACE